MTNSNAPTQGQATISTPQRLKPALYNFDNAIVRFKKLLMKDHYPFTDYDFYINQKRYKLMEIDSIKYIVMFKRDFFMTYFKDFPEDADQIGETINREGLKQGIANGATHLIYLYDNGNIYYARIADLLNHWHLRTTDNENKEQYCFGISNLKRWE